jgi:uncharacterized protein
VYNTSLVNQTAIRIVFSNHELVLDAAGGLYWPAEKLLVVSDLHFEKGSYLASVGHPLPIYDTYDTLCRLDSLIVHYKPDHVVCLGDNVHDANAWQRMREQDLFLLQTLSQKVQNWHWIIGNHDKDEQLSEVLSHTHYHSHLTINQLTFSHDLLPVSLQIIGHFHPKVSILTKAAQIVGKCFVVTPDKIILPAFGSYTGGLHVKNPAFHSIFNTNTAQFFLLYREKIWRIK